jgi:CTP:molybdopterin cytidylyltransferase MocA
MRSSSADDAQALVSSPPAQPASSTPAVPVTVAAIILAAPDTLSDREHLSPALQHFTDLPLIVHAVNLVRGIGASPIVIACTSSDEAKVREAVRPHIPPDELMCVNQDQEQGPLGGLRAGLADLLEETTHALVLPATMPLLTIKALETMNAASKVAPLVRLEQAACR